MIIKILASDFNNNYFMNSNNDETGCPIIRALIRAGIKPGKVVETAYGRKDFNIGVKVADMFLGKIPIEDFEFEYTE